MPINSQMSTMGSSIDQNELLARCMGNRALVEKLIGAFIQTIPIEKLAIQSAIAIGDLTAVARIAHKLCGTAANMCAMPLSDSARQVEQAARSNQIDLVARLSSEVYHQFEEVIGALSAREPNPL